MCKLHSCLQSQVLVINSKSGICFIKCYPQQCKSLYVACQNSYVTRTVWEKSIVFNRKTAAGGYKKLRISITDLVSFNKSTIMQQWFSHYLIEYCLWDCLCLWISIIYCFLPQILFFFIQHCECCKNRICKCWLKLNGKLMYVIKMDWSCLLYVLTY